MRLPTRHFGVPEAIVLVATLLGVAWTYLKNLLHSFREHGRDLESWKVGLLCVLVVAALALISVRY